MDRQQYNRIREVLDEKGKDVYWLQERLGETIPNVVRWSKNVNQPSIEILFEIAKILDVDVKDLLVSTKIVGLDSNAKECDKRIIVDAKDYNLQNDKRLLIPFVEVRRKAKIYIPQKGMLNKGGEIVVEPKYDVVVGDCFAEDDLLVMGKYYQEDGNPYIFCHYDIYTGKGDMLISDVVDFVLSTDRKIATVFVNSEYEYGWGVINSKNEWIIPPGKYDWVSGFNKGHARVKSGSETNGHEDAIVLWGIVNSDGLEVVPLKYHNIHNFYDSDYDSIKVEKDKNSGTESISLGELSSIWRIMKARGKKVREEREKEIKAIHQRMRKQEEEKYWDTYGYSHREYKGIYSDDAISDAFDGDPEACWNAD